MDQSSYLSNVLWQYRLAGQFTDVTLVCADGRVFAHAAVLSGFFSGFGLHLEESPDLLLLPDINSHELEESLKTVYLSNSTESLFHLVNNNDSRRIIDGIEDDTKKDILVLRNFSIDLPNLSRNTATIPNKSTNEKILLGVSQQAENQYKRKHRKNKKYHKPIVRLVTQFMNKRDGDPCQYCFKPFKARTHTKHLIMRHRKLIISNHPEIYEQFNVQCEECDEKFLRKASDLAQHMREMHGKGNHIPCPYCETLSSNNTHLNYHIFFVHKEKRKSSSTT